MSSVPSAEMDKVRISYLEWDEIVHPLATGSGLFLTSHDVFPQRELSTEFEIDLSG